MESFHSEGHHGLFFRVNSKILVLLSYSKYKLPLDRWISVFWKTSLDSVLFHRLLLGFRIRMGPMGKFQTLIASRY